MNESTFQLIYILPFIAFCFLMIVGFSLYLFSYDKKIDRGVIKRNSLTGIIAVSLVSIASLLILSPSAGISSQTILLSTMSIGVKATLFYCLLMCLLHHKSTMALQLTVFFIVSLFCLATYSYTKLNHFNIGDDLFTLALISGSILYLHNHFKQPNNINSTSQQETPGTINLCATLVIVTATALLHHSSVAFSNFLIVISSCFLTALLFSLCCEKKINLRFISNCLVVLSIMSILAYKTIVTGWYNYTVPFAITNLEITKLITEPLALILFGSCVVLVVIAMRYIVNKLNINDRLDITLIILTTTLFTIILTMSSTFDWMQNLLLIASLFSIFIAGALITMFTLLLIRIINPMVVYRSGIIRESKRDIEKRILLSKNALIILDTENCKASNLKKAFSLASNLSKIKSVKIAVPSHLLAPAETNTLASDSKIRHDMIITDVDEINSAIESCDLQIIIGNHYHQLSMKTNNNNDQKNNRLMTDKAKTSIIISDKRKIRIHQSNQRSLILYYTGSITDFQGIIKQKSKDEMRDKVHRSSNLAEKFIVSIGFCITSVLTIVTAFIYPEYTSHIALFGLLSLCAFYVSHNINSNMHTPFLNWITIPCSVIILFCLPLANSGPLEIVIISCALILFFLMNIVLSSTLAINTKMLALFNRKKQSRKLKPIKAKKLNR